MGLFWRGPVVDVAVPMARFVTGALGDVCVVSGEPAEARMLVRAVTWPHGAVVGALLARTVTAALLTDKRLGRVPVARRVWLADHGLRWLGRGALAGSFVFAIARPDVPHAAVWATVAFAAFVATGRVRAANTLSGDHLGTGRRGRRPDRSAGGGPIAAALWRGAA